MAANRQSPASEWLTYNAAAERLGLSPAAIALRAGRWPTRRRSDTGEVEIEVPGTLLGSNIVAAKPVIDHDLRRRVAQAVHRAHLPTPVSEECPFDKIFAALRDTWGRLISNSRRR